MTGQPETRREVAAVLRERNAQALAGYWPYTDPPLPVSQFAAWRLVMAWWFALWCGWTGEQIDHNFVWGLDEW